MIHWKSSWYHLDNESLDLQRKKSGNQWLDDTTPRFLYDDTTVVLNGIVSEDYKGEQQEPFVKV